MNKARGRLLRGMVSQVTSTNLSNPLPQVGSLVLRELCCICSMMKKTQVLNMLPYSESTSLVAASFLGFGLSVSSIWLRVAGPLAWVHLGG